MADILTSKSMFGPIVSRGAANSQPNRGVARDIHRSYCGRIHGLGFGAKGRCVTGASHVSYRIIGADARIKSADAMSTAVPSMPACAYTAEHRALLAASRPKFPNGAPAAGASFDFTAICRRFGQFVARATFRPEEVSTDWLLGGEPPGLLTMRPEGRETGMEMGMTGVYVPFHQEARHHIHLVGMILYAARGCGADVYTDVYVRDGRWACMLPAGAMAVETAMRAVCWLVDSAEMSGYGCLHLAHFLFGLHDIASVEAHTDEGGMMRDIIRRMGSRLPNGMISGKPVQRLVLHMPAWARSVGAFNGGVDSMLLRDLRPWLRRCE